MLGLFRSPISYFTVETATSLAPEWAALIIPFAILSPIIWRYWFRQKRNIVFAGRFVK